MNQLVLYPQAASQQRPISLMEHLSAIERILYNTQCNLQRAFSTEEIPELAWTYHDLTEARKYLHTVTQMVGGGQPWRG